MTLEVEDRDGVQIRVFTDIVRVRVCGGRYTEGENAGQPLIGITVNEEGEDRPASGLRPAATASSRRPMFGSRRTVGACS